MAQKAIALLAATASLLVSTCCGGRSEPQTIRMGVLPILDTLPLYVAEQEGFFEERGVTVTLIPAASAAERDQLMQAGEIDGIITDLVALSLYNRETTQVLGVRYAMTPTEGFPQFRIMASAESGFSRPEELAGVQIGVSEGTVIEYVTDRLLASEGVAAAEIETLGVPKIPERMALLRSGELAAATLPEPLASLAQQQGAEVIVDDTEQTELSCSIYAFRKGTLEAQPEAVRALLAAVSEASRAINMDKGRWSSLLADQNLVPQPLMGSYELPDYPADETPTERQFVDAAAWLMENGVLAKQPRYADSISDSYLP